MDGLQGVLVPPEIIYKMQMCAYVHLLGGWVQNFHYILKGIYGPKCLTAPALRHTPSRQTGQSWSSKQAELLYENSFSLQPPELPTLQTSPSLAQIQTLF